MKSDALEPSPEGRRLLDELVGKQVCDTRSGVCGVLVDVIGSTAYARMPSALEWRAPIGCIAAIPANTAEGQAR
ncbi:hypothetical protein ACIBSV_44890 [Embleya sp. NPDC050154]|uniref:hypothetical protein n=1 Tax=Embleya sp. NPDC050154 TaxID=3363988 RepID=UPI0037B0D9C2